MWDKLLALFKDKEVTDNVRFIAPDVEQVGEHSQPKDFSTKSSNVPQGPSTQIGYNYLKGLDDETENSAKHMRRFINLNKLLRGNFDGKVTTTDAKSENNIRGEDSK